jgi:hypothetical protein
MNAINSDSRRQALAISIPGSKVAFGWAAPLFQQVGRRRPRGQFRHVQSVPICRVLSVLTPAICRPSALIAVG